jgi:hypothetical protein
MNDLKFTIKNLKTWSTHDGGGYQFSLYLNDKKFAFVHNDGNGGEVEVECLDVDAPKVEISTWTDKDGKVHGWHVTPHYALLSAYVKGLPKWESYTGDLVHVTIGMFMDTLVNNYEFDKKLAKAKKKGIVFKLNTDSNRTFRSINTLDMDIALSYLNKKFPNAYQFV